MNDYSSLLSTIAFIVIAIILLIVIAVNLNWIIKNTVCKLFGHKLNKHKMSMTVFNVCERCHDAQITFDYKKPVNDAEISISCKNNLVTIKITGEFYDLTDILHVVYQRCELFKALTRLSTTIDSPINHNLKVKRSIISITNRNSKEKETSLNN